MLFRSGTRLFPGRGEAKKESKEEVAPRWCGQIKPITHSKTSPSPRILSHTNQRHTNHPSRNVQFQPPSLASRQHRQDFSSRKNEGAASRRPRPTLTTLAEFFERVFPPPRHPCDRFLPRRCLSTEINDSASFMNETGKKLARKLEEIIPRSPVPVRATGKLSTTSRILVFSLKSSNFKEGTLV